MHRVSDHTHRGRVSDMPDMAGKKPGGEPEFFVMLDWLNV